MSLITPLQGPMNDEVLLRTTPPALVLTLARAGTLTLDDFWGVADPRAHGDFRNEWGRPAPGGLLWAWRNPHKGLLREPTPTPALWEALDREDPHQPSAILTERDRVLAWMFSDPRVWTTGRLERSQTEGFNTPLDWAVAENQDWAIDSAFRQPQAPRLSEKWWAQALTDQVTQFNLGTLATLARHSPAPLASIRVTIDRKIDSGKDKFKANVGEEGYPLLHLVTDPRMVNLLLELGVDPLATDHDGCTADEHWKKRGSPFVADNRRLDPTLLNMSLVLFTKALAALPPEATLAIRQRQDEHIFKTAEIEDFGEWLLNKPRDLRVGPHALLPNELLFKIPATQQELSRRAALLLQHQDAPALARMSKDGVEERDALWWALACGELKAPLPTVRKAWKEAFQKDVWLGSMKAGQTLMQRHCFNASGHSKIPQGMTNAAAELISKAMSNLTGSKPCINPALDALTPTSIERWDSIGSDGTTVLEQCLHIINKGVEKGEKLKSDHFNNTFAPLAKWLHKHPLDANGQARQGILDALLILFSRSINPGHLDSLNEDEMFLAMTTNHEIFATETRRMAMFLKAAHPLIQAGAIPGDAAVSALAGSPCSGTKSGHKMVSYIKELALEKSLGNLSLTAATRKPRI